MIAALVILPIGIGRGIGAPWSKIAIAFGIVAVVSTVWGFSSGDRSLEMRFVWAAVVFMILAIAGVPLVLGAMWLMGYWGAR